MRKWVVIGLQYGRGFQSIGSSLVSELSSGDTDISTLWSLSECMIMTYISVPCY